MSEPSNADIRRAAMDLLARREHSQLELKRKLERRFGASDFIPSEIERLHSEGLQSDERLVEAFIRSRVNRGNGPVKIRHELRGKGVNEDLIQQCMDIMEPDWVSLARDVLVRRYGNSNDSTSLSDIDLDEGIDSSQPMPIDAKERGRRSRFLQQRGFSFDQIRYLFR